MGLDFYLRVYECVRVHSRLPVPSSLGVSKQAMNYYVKRLKVAGMISRRGYGVWEVKGEYNDLTIVKQVKKVKISTALGPKQVKLLPVRGHGFRFTLRLPKGVFWGRDKRRSFLDSKGVVWRALRLNWDGEAFVFGGCKTHFTPRGILVWFPRGESFFGPSAGECKRFAVFEVLRRVKRLEVWLGVSLRVRGKYLFRVSRQHYASVCNELAVQVNRRKEKLFVRDEGGCWLWADFSFSEDELECGGRERSDVHLDRVVAPFFNGLKAHFERSGETLTVGGLLRVVEGVAENQAVFGENLVSHVGAVRALGVAVEKLARKVDELRGL